MQHGPAERREDSSWRDHATGAADGQSAVRTRGQLRRAPNLGVVLASEVERQRGQHARVFLRAVVYSRQEVAVAGAVQFGIGCTGVQLANKAQHSMHGVEQTHNMPPPTIYLPPRTFWRRLPAQVGSASCNTTSTGSL